MFLAFPSHSTTASQLLHYVGTGKLRDVVTHERSLPAHLLACNSLFNSWSYKRNEDVADHVVLLETPCEPLGNWSSPAAKSLYLDKDIVAKAILSVPLC